MTEQEQESLAQDAESVIKQLTAKHRGLHSVAVVFDFTCPSDRAEMRSWAWGDQLAVYTGAKAYEDVEGMLTSAGDLHRHLLRLWERKAREREDSLYVIQEQVRRETEELREQHRLEIAQQRERIDELTCQIAALEESRRAAEEAACSRTQTQEPSRCQDSAGPT